MNQEEWKKRYEEQKKVEEELTEFLTRTDFSKNDLLYFLEQVKMFHDKFNDTERAHELADAGLIRYIDDKRVTGTFHNLPRWYS
jgi:adenosylcobinamide amidohydrolase